MEPALSTGTGIAANPESKTRPTSSTLQIDSTSPSDLSVSTFNGRSANIDSAPVASVTSSSPSSTTAANHSMHVSPLAHPLDSTSSSSSSDYPEFIADRTHGFDSLSHIPPQMTSGEEMVFDRGLLFTSHRPSTRSDPSHDIAGASLPSLGNINRTSSDPESADLDKEVLPGRASPDQNRVGFRPSEVRSTPISIPVIHHPSPATSNAASTALSQGFLSRPPSPNPSTITQGSSMSHRHQQQSQHLAPNSSFSSVNQNDAYRPYNQCSPPAALRPDSVSSFPDNSPVLAPSVLAAVDARLKEASRQRALASSPSASSLRPPRPQSTIPGTTHSNDSRASKISSLGLSTPIMTHHSVLASSESIRSREDLYDALNKDDDDDESDKGLTRPRPGFASSGRQSSKSSRRNSVSSSAAGSGIEMNERGDRYMAASLPKRVQVRANEGSTKGSKKKELASVAMVSQDQKNESYIYVDSGLAYLEKSEWLKSKSRTSRKWRGICCVVGILALIGVVAGIVIGFVTRKGKIDGLAQPPDPDKPQAATPPITQFTPNPNLYKSFYGIDYNPAESLMPWCGATLQNVINDVILISQLTNRIRLYGMDCDQAALTFQAIQALNLNSTMKVVLTVWVDGDPVTYQRQYDTLFEVLDTYGTDMVQGISIGNEVLFRQEMNLTSLASVMATVRTNVQTRYGKAIPVFTSEVGTNLNSALALVSDELEGNLHPYFAGTEASDAAAWTFGQYNDTVLANPTKAGIKGAISEVGWPTAPATSVYAPSAVPGVANLQTLIDTFICQANTAGIPYYWFEFKDEAWKSDLLVPVEPYWGIFDKDGNLKIKVPNCTAP